MFNMHLQLSCLGHSTSDDPKNGKMKPAISDFHKTWQDNRFFASDHKKLNFQNQIGITQFTLIQNFLFFTQAEKILSDLNK